MAASFSERYSSRKNRPFFGWRSSILAENANPTRHALAPLPTAVENLAPAQGSPAFSFKRMANYLANNPLDFVASTVTSMATFMAVKYTVTVFLGIATGPFLASPIIASMITAGIITTFRATSQAMKERDARIDALEHNSDGNAVDPAELAEARKLNVKAIIRSAVRHALFSGIVGAIFGALVYDHFPNLTNDGPTAAEGPSTDAPATPSTEGAEILVKEAGTTITQTDHKGYKIFRIKNLGDIDFTKDREGGGIDHAEDTLLVLNGPLFEYNGIPTGMYIDDGNVVGQLTDPSDPKFHKTLPDGTVRTANFADNNGIFGQTKKGEVFLMTYDEWNAAPLETKDIKWAFQNGAILLDQDANGGISNPHSPSTATKPIPRTAIGYDKDTEELIVLFCNDQTNMHLMAERMRDAGAENAMYLDGTKAGLIPKDGAMIGEIPDGSTIIEVKGQGRGLG